MDEQGTRRSGDSQCAAFCDAKAVDYVDADKAHLRRKRKAALEFSDLMRCYVA